MHVNCKVDITQLQLLYFKLQSLFNIVAFSHLCFLAYLFNSNLFCCESYDDYGDRVCTSMPGFVFVSIYLFILKLWYLFQWNRTKLPSENSPFFWGVVPVHCVVPPPCLGSWGTASYGSSSCHGRVTSHRVTTMLQVTLPYWNTWRFCIGCCFCRDNFVL